MGTDRLVFIRTDGNSQIATGHLMRCLSIADACVTLGMQVCFLVSDSESEELLNGFLSSFAFTKSLSVTKVPGGNYQDLSAELPHLFSLLTHILAEKDCAICNAVFFLDSYYVTPEYLDALKGRIKIAYLDDLQLFDYPVDLLINYDVIPDACMPSYLDAYQKAGKALLGGAYTPLRSQFQNRKGMLRDTVSDILITTGGSDPFHFCLKLIQAIKANSFLVSNPILLHVVIGRLNTDRDKLYELAEKLSFLHLHENVSNMASLMETCDLAVSASGTTLYELCALGIPAISFTMADNQLPSAEAFAKAGAVPCAGDLRHNDSIVIQDVINFVTYMSQNISKRKSAHETMSRLIDGNGAKRIAEAIFQLSC